MSLMNKIEDLQRRPESVRRRVLFVSLAVIMFVVIAVWVSTLKVTLGASLNAEKAQSVYTPFGAIADVFKDGIEMFKK